MSTPVTPAIPTDPAKRYALDADTYVIRNDDGTHDAVLFCPHDPMVVLRTRIQENENSLGAWRRLLDAYANIAEHGAAVRAALADRWAAADANGTLVTK